MRSDRTMAVAYTALMAALVFVATYLIKIPNPAREVTATWETV